MKRFLAFLLSLALCLSLCPSALAVEPEPQSSSSGTYNGLTYTLENGAVTIDGPTTVSGVLTIPATIENTPVTAIGAGAFAGSEVTAVIFPAGLTSIGAGAFQGCSLLTDISFASGAAADLTVGADAFTHGREYERGVTVYLPDTDSIPAALSGYGWTAALYYVQYTETSADPLFGTVPMTLTGINGRVDTMTLHYAVLNGEATITGYENGMVEGYNGEIWGDNATLQAVLPASAGGYPVTAVGSYAFTCGLMCSELTIPEGVERIGAYAFYLAVIICLRLPASLETIEDCGFYDIAWLKRVRFAHAAGAALTIGANAFWTYEPSSLEIYGTPPASVTGYNWAGDDWTVSYSTGDWHSVTCYLDDADWISLYDYDRTYSETETLVLPTCGDYPNNFRYGGNGIRNLYVFDGWYTNPQFTGDPVTTVSGSSDTEVYGRWRFLGRTLRIDPNGGELSSSTSAGWMEMTSGYLIPLIYQRYLSRDHYSFQGFSDSPTGPVQYSPRSTDSSLNQYAVSDIVDEGETVTLYAIWQLSDGNLLTFNANGGTGTMEDVAVGAGDTVPACTFTRDGYVFVGWSTQANGQGTVYQAGDVLSTLPGAEGATVTLYAKWAVQRYTVVFHANNDTDATATQSLVINKRNQTLSTPGFVKTGYTLAGWATTADSADTAYLPGATVTQNLTELFGGTVDLYAVWAVKSYTVAFSGNGGTGYMADIACNYGESYTLDGCGFERPGYTFAGWARNSYSGAEFADGASIENLTATAGAKVWLYAIWTRNTYTVSFAGNGAESGDMSGSTMTMAYGAYSKLPDNVFTREGYTFAYWTTNAEGSGTRYTDEANVVNITTLNGAEITLYAQWRANVYSVVFHANDGTGVDVSRTQRVTCGTDATLYSNSFSKTGYTFTGWARTDDAVTAEFANAASVRNLATTDNEVVDLYAVWRNNTYNVVFSANGGYGNTTGGTSGSTTPNTVTYTYDVTTELPACSFIRTGYTFQGWGRSTYAKTLITEADNLTTTSNGTVYLYAIWEPNTYTVKFNGNGADNMNGEDGDMSSITMDMVYGIYGKLPANTYTRTGYSFAGWRTQPNGTGNAYSNGAVSSGMTAVNGAEVTLYAQWSRIGYYVKFHANNGTEVTKYQRLAYDTPAALSGNSFSRTGYTLAYWTTNADGTGTRYTNAQTVQNLTTTENEVIDLYAQWRANTYTVTFNTNGGLGNITADIDGATPNALSYTYDVAEELPVCNYHRAGYAFAGWSTSPYGTAVYADEEEIQNLTATANGRVTLYAVWTPITYTVYFSGNGGDGEMTETTMTYSQYANLPVNTFVRDNYTFVGWSLNPTSGTVYADEANVVNLTDSAAAVTLYARWKLNTACVSIHAATLSFSTNGGTGTAPESITLQTGTGALLPANQDDAFSRAGYTFVGWNTQANGNGTTYNLGSSVTKASTGDSQTVTLYAKWQANRYTVVFHSNNGVSQERQQSLRYGTTTALYGNAFSKTGYTFAGWNTEADGTGTSYTNCQSVLNLIDQENGIVHLYAQWRANAYTVNFSGNGGTGDLSGLRRQCTYDQSFTVPAPASSFVRTGYVFQGWTTNLYGGRVYPAGSSASNLTAGNNANVYLYAVWAPNECTVSYNGNGATTGDMTGVTTHLTYGVYDNLEENVFTRTGYTFVGWNTKADGTGTNYGSGAQVSAISATSHTVTLYAKWQANRYSVTFHSNDGDNEKLRRQNFSYGTNANLWSNEFTRTGYSLLGWSEDPDATTPTYANYQVVGNLRTESNAEVNLYAVWAIRQYSVVCYPNDGTSNKTEPVTYNCNQTYNLDANTFTRTGYTFAGWALSSYGAVVYTDEAEIYNLTTTANGRVNLYAKWTPKSCTVHFDANAQDAAGTAVADMNMTYGCYVTLPACTYTRTGYTFVGWNTRADGTGTSYSDRGTVSTIPVTTGDVTLYAKWQANLYTVAFHSTGCPDVRQTIRYGTSTYLSYNGFTRTGYTFAGWATAEDSTTVVYANHEQILNLTAVDGAVVDLYAVWTPRTYTVSFSANGGSGSMPIQTFTYDTAGTLTACTFQRNGYTFAGWALSSYGNVAYTDGQSVSNLNASGGRVYLYAKWTPNS